MGSVVLGSIILVAVYFILTVRLFVRHYNRLKREYPGPQALPDYEDDGDLMPQVIGRRDLCRDAITSIKGVDSLGYIGGGCLGIAAVIGFAGSQMFFAGALSGWALCAIFSGLFIQILMLISDVPNNSVKHSYERELKRLNEVITEYEQLKEKAA
jgi:hypothetical protein